MPKDHPYRGKEAAILEILKRPRQGRLVTQNNLLKRFDEDEQAEVETALDNLSDDNYITFSGRSSNYYIRLTEKGRTQDWE